MDSVMPPLTQEQIEYALSLVAHLGHGGDGPFEDRTHVIAGKPTRYTLVKAWVNATYSVQLISHANHPGVDHLLLRRHDEGLTFPWSDMQRIKDRLLGDGQFRWALEYFPPRMEIVDNAPLRHLWVMPKGWEPPIKFDGDVRC